MLALVKESCFICPLMAARAIRVVLVLDMTDQDTAADQSNRTEHDEPERTEYVERTDVGVSLTVKLKRGTGTRDQDEVIAKAKGSTLNDARKDMDELRGYIRDLAADARQIQPNSESDE